MATNDHSSPEPWRSLRVGDRVRIVRVPSEFSRENYYVPAETLALYDLLITGGVIVAVVEVDEHGIPWIGHDYVDEDGQEGFHVLAINDDSWEPLSPE